ncbi:hypothetical protein HW555_005405 [Spodoptera exigua]|uniref:Uncharacterized protein n=1 Tax=Spodoptera exigua TaxID=7107 RepID=A0A835GHX6_SPOEX|nr:hypothetical protein HW555_005405 [Spodoptera exigua]
MTTSADASADESLRAVHTSPGRSVYVGSRQMQHVTTSYITLFLRRNSMENQFAELYAEPSGEFNNFVRMSSSDFEYLLQKISPTIAKKDTDWRDAIPVKVRLAVTLRYLATGDSYRSLHYLFKISSQVISIIVPEVCLALNNVLKDLVKSPNSEDKYLNGELIQPGSWRQNYTGTFDPLQPIPRRAPACAVETRLKFTRYINENNH